MVTSKTIKEYLSNAVALGYDVHEALNLVDDIKTEDDISEAFRKLREMDDDREYYYQELSLDDVINIINNAKGVNKYQLKKTLTEKLKYVV